MRRVICAAAWLLPVVLCLSTCIKPQQLPEALDPAVVEAEIFKAKGIPIARADSSTGPLVALAEPPKEPAPPKPEPPKEPTPAPAKEPTPPKPEPPKEPTPPKPEPAKPEPPKEGTAEPPKPEPRKPEPPKEPAPQPPKPEPPKAPTPEPPKPEPPKEPAPEPPKPEPPKPAPPEAAPPKPAPPKPAPPKPAPPRPEPPKPEPPKEPVPIEAEGGDKLFLFSPQQRQLFVAGETAEFTLVIASSTGHAQAAVTLSVTNEGGDAWTATDALGVLAAGRHSLTYGVDVGCFPPGAYKVSARLGERASNPVELSIGPSAPRTHFRLAAWPDKAPHSAIEARRWSKLLGLNTALIKGRTPAGAEGTLVMDEVFVATGRGMRGERDARPLELGVMPPPFAQGAERLMAHGLGWLDATALWAGVAAHLPAERDPVNPQAVRGPLPRIHQLLQAERRFPKCAGIFFADDTLLPREGTGDEATPFGVPSQLEAYKRLSEAKDLPWKEGSARWNEWHPFQAFRAGIVGDWLAAWGAAARAAGPGFCTAALLHPPIRLADGAYPPLAAKGLSAILATASITGPAGMMMPAAVTDLMRMGNWGKELWFMPEIADEADLDEVRAAIALALSRKIEGVVYPGNLDWLLDRPAAGPGQTQLLADVAAINHQLTQLGDFLLALQKPRDDVAILYSLTEHIERMGREPVKDPEAISYPWSLIAAYNVCLFAHFPATFITEEELIAAPKLGSKVILAIGLSRIRPEVKGALERHAASGGVVLTDSTAKVEIAGARKLAIEFPDLPRYHEELKKGVADEKVHPELERRDAAVNAKLLYPLVGPLRAELRSHIERDYTSADPDIIVCDQRCGAGRYIFLVNNTQRTDLYRGLPWELAAARTRLTFREGDYAVYEAVEGKRVFPTRERTHPGTTTILPPGALRIYALLPEAIRGVRISSASLGRGGLAISARVHGEARTLLGATKPINAAVPIEITLTAPSGREHLRVYRAHTPGGYSETLPTGSALEPGTWTLEVRELLSGQKASTTFRSRAAAGAWASRRGPIAAFDGPRIAAVLRDSPALAIVAGTAEEAAKAEPLAAALRSESRQVEIKLAGEVPSPGPSRGDGERTPTAILLGEVSTHPIIRRVHNAGVVPRTVTPDYPGPGGALLCRALSALEPGDEAVVAAASDAAGVDAAVQALIGAARGAAPQAAWQSLGSSRYMAAASRPKPPRVDVLPIAWTYRGTDVPTAIAVPLQGSDVTIGFFDGMCLTFNRTGKEVWRRRCTTRTRAVARSLDGIWAAIGSFPELLMVSAQGRLQFAAVTEAGPRADYTAVALAPDGVFTVAGTRQGGLIAYDLQGNMAFGIGVPEPREPAEGEGLLGEEKPKEAEPPKPVVPSKLGCVNVIAVSPKTGSIAAGGEAATMAVDSNGQELWTSADLNRVASLAWSYAEDQTLAVGTRGGVVACLTGGTTLWRHQAEAPVMSVCFRGESQEVVAASLDGTLTCYDKNGKELWARRSEVGWRFVASSLDGTLVAAAEAAGRVMLLDKSGQLVAHTPPIQGAICAFGFSPDGERIVVGTVGGEILAFKHKRMAADVDEL